MNSQKININQIIKNPQINLNQQSIINPFQYYYKQNDKKIIHNNPEIIKSPKINQNQFKVQITQAKHQFLPIQRLTNKFTKISTNQKINSVKSTIITSNKNIISNFQPGTLASMARFIPQNNNLKNQINYQNENQSTTIDNNLYQKKIQKSPMIFPKYIKQNDQKPNVYRSIVYPLANQRLILKKTPLIVENMTKNNIVQADNNKQKTKQYLQKQFFNKYSAQQKKTKKIDFKSTKSQVQYLKSPSQKIFTVQKFYQNVYQNRNLKKDFSGHLIVASNNKKTENFTDFHQQLKKFQQDHFSITTTDTPVKQKRVFKPVFFKNNKLTTHSDNKISSNELKIPIYELFEHKKNQTCIKKTTSYFLEQSFSFNEDKNEKTKKWSIDDFEIGDKLGKGAFGDVFIARQRIIGFICVIKRMSKKRIKQQKREQHVLRQIKIQSHLNHSNIAPLYGYFDDKQSLYLIIQYLPDGNLSQMKQRHKKTQKQTANILYQVCKGLSYMHNLQIIHRDIKPQNIFVNQSFMKIGDFGCSVFTDKLRKTIVSCLQYSSPEQLNNEYYNQKIDVWSIGILAYELLTGKSPYQSQLMSKIRQNDQINFNDLKYPENLEISSIAKDLISRLLNTNPLERLNIYQALDHQFIKLNIQSNNKNQSQNYLIKQIQNLLKA